MERLKYAVKARLEVELLQIIPKPLEDSNNLVVKFFIDELLRWLGKIINWNTSEASLRKTELIYELSGYVQHYMNSQFHLSYYKDKHDEIVSAIVNTLIDVVWLEDSDTTK